MQSVSNTAIAKKAENKLRNVNNVDYQVEVIFPSGPGTTVSLSLRLE